MIPATFQNYFLASTQTSATLAGLLFVAISIAPERLVTREASVEQRTVALSAYTALLNTFFLSSVALLPQTNLGSIALLLSMIGLVNQCLLGWNLFKHPERTWPRMIGGIVLIIIGLLLYEGELYNAFLLVLSPTSSAPISMIADLLLGIYAIGLIRAWQLLGGWSRSSDE